jgi:hypothetical protein
MATSLFESEAKSANTVEPLKQFKEGVYEPEGADELRRSMAGNKSSAAVKPAVKALPAGQKRALAPAKGRERWAAQAPGPKRETSLRSVAPAAAAAAPPVLPPVRAQSTRSGRIMAPPPPPPSRARMERRV